MNIFQNCFFTSKCFLSCWYTVIYLFIFHNSHCMLYKSGWGSILPCLKLRYHHVKHLHEDIMNNLLRCLPLSMTVIGALMTSFKQDPNFQIGKVKKNSSYIQNRRLDCSTVRYLTQSFPLDLLLSSGQLLGSNQINYMSL